MAADCPGRAGEPHNRENRHHALPAKQSEFHVCALLCRRVALFLSAAPSPNNCHRSGHCDEDPPLFGIFDEIVQRNDANEPTAIAVAATSSLAGPQNSRLVSTHPQLL